MIDQTSTPPFVTAKQTKSGKQLIRTVRKVLGQCKKLKKTLGRTFTKTKGSYDVTTPSVLSQKSRQAEKNSTGTSRSDSEDADVIENKVVGRTPISDQSESTDVSESQVIEIKRTSLRTIAERKPEMPRLKLPHHDVSGRYDKLELNSQTTDAMFQAGRAMLVDIKPEETVNKTPFNVDGVDIRSSSTHEKCRLNSKLSSFQKLDKRAVQISRLGINSLEKVARKLTQGCETDTDTARVLFRWVVERDLRQRRSAERPPRQCYHRLYQNLCRLSGLRCEIIRGFSKGAGYKPGMRIRNNCFRNSWTAVAIDDTWRLVNCTWAARRHRTGDKFNTVDEFYFLTDPRDHIYQHFPDDPAWQLLETPISEQSFVELPLLKSNYFNSRLRLKGGHPSAILAGNGRSEIRLVVPDNVDIGSCLTSTDRSGHLIDGQTSLRWENNEAVFTVSSPNTDSFYLTIYAGKFGENLESACCFRISIHGISCEVPFV